MPLKDKKARLAYQAEWAANNRERTRAAARRCYRNGGRERNKLYREAHREADTKYKQEWKKRNPEKVIQYNRKWRKESRDHILSRARQYRAKNSARFQVYNAQRIARKRQAKGNCSLTQWLARVAFFGWCCRYCKCSLTNDTVEMDHSIAISRDGSSWPSNLVPACRTCNRGKQNKSYTEYMIYRSQCA